MTPSRPRLVLVAAVLTAAALTTPVAAGQVAPASPDAGVDPYGVLGQTAATQVELRAENLVDITSYDVVFDLTPLTSVTPTRTGQVDIALTLPAAACGDHRVALDDPVTGTTVVSTPFRVMCPSLRLQPSRLTPSTLPNTIAVLPGDDFDYSGDDTAKALVVDGGAPQRERYRDPIAIAPSVACGIHQVQLFQANDVVKATLSASAQYVVLCPAAAVDPVGIARDSQPTPVTVSGSGLDPATPISVAIDDRPVATATTDGTGALSKPVTVAGLDCGDHAVTLTEQQVRPPARAATTLTVTCPGVDLAVAPAVVAEGMTTQVSGSGFVPNQPVTLVWQLSDGSTVAADGSPAKPDANGRLSFYCLILAHQDVGGRTLVATQSVDTVDGTVAQIVAKASAVVQGGTMQPSMLNRVGPQLVFRR